MEKEVFEIFEDFTRLKAKSEKIAFLQQVGREVPAVKDVIRGAFDDRLVFVLPKGTPPYTPNLPESTPSSLRMRHRDFSYFVKGAINSEQPAYKVEKMFIQMLESIHAEDALIVLDMVSKKTPVKGLTKKLVEEAFPKLLS
jgi:hypothetical protein